MARDHLARNRCVQGAGAQARVADAGKGGRILLVDDRPSSYERLAPVLVGRA